MEESILGALVVFYRTSENGQEYLLVQNTQSGNITFVGGAQENGETLKETMQREVYEELGLEISGNVLIPTDIWHEFVFDANKPDRAGKPGKYQVFISSCPVPPQIRENSEIKSHIWITEDAENRIKFPDLRSVFKKTIAVINRLNRV